MNEIKEWKTQSVKHKIATVLIIDGVAFSYDEENGIVFTAPEVYVQKLIYRLKTCYVVSTEPIINEINK